MAVPRGRDHLRLRVDQVELDCPYVMNEEYLNSMIKKHNLDYIVYGDDPCIVDGKDVYQTAVDKGMYRTIPRTEGVSTTEIVGRMLLMTKDHHDLETASTGRSRSLSFDLQDETDGDVSAAYRGRETKFLTTNSMLQQFGKGVKPPKPGDKIVYIDGGMLQAA